MKDFAHERLPRGYELYETVDLAGKAMKVMAIFVVLLTLGMVLWGILFSGHPVSEAFQMEAFRIAFAAGGMIMGMVVYLFVHEGVHGFFIKMFSGTAPFYGKDLKKGMFYAGSSFFGHNHRTVGDIACPLIAFLENLKLQSDATTTTRHINNCTVTTGNGPFSFSGCD